MRRTLQLGFAVWAIGCAGESPTQFDQFDHLAPPSPNVAASTRVVSTGNILSLEVTALVTNPTTTRFTVSAGAQCPSIRIFSDPSGEYQLSSGPGPCASDAALDLAPGDTVVLKRVLTPDYLAAFAPGLYGVNVEVGTQNVQIGVWAGAVRLPLAGPP